MRKLRKLEYAWLWDKSRMPPRRGHHLPSYSTPEAARARAQETHARGIKGFQGMLSMDQALYWEGRQHRVEHSPKANRLSLGTIKWCCL